ncbi:MAG: single-stranded-DNA-specific exonuclease RecJ, partial [Burkholderiales bacterium]
MTPTLVARDCPPRAAWQLEQGGVPPLLARLYAARGVRQVQELDPQLAQLLPPSSMKGLPEAARLLADLLEQGQRLCVVADYDCDGATACALLLRGLALLGFAPGQLSYVVPDRAVHGYGLTPAIVDLAAAEQPRLLVTVDNGIASLEGVAHAKRLGMQVLVTDHHLCLLDAEGQVQLPEADALVNPNQPGCNFESKALAGCGVAFYLLLALRAELRARGAFEVQPKLDGLLDLVALGTVADVVPLDANNRRLVTQGLRRIRAGQMQAGVRALLQVAGRDPARTSSQDFGFLLGPRINAAGRLTDMRLGIECLRCDDALQALALAQQLDAINRERREVEAGMRERAEAMLDRLPDEAHGCALALFDEDFHEGVVGILASRVKDSLHRPTFVF